MSLIQEALKRQQMEQEGKLPATPVAGTNGAPPAMSTAVEGETFVLPGVGAEPEVDDEKPEAPAKPTLKRSVNPAAAEKPRDSSPATPVQPAENDPDRRRVMPTPPDNDEPDRKKTRVLPALVAIVIFLVILTGALLWAVSFGLELAGIRMPWSAEKPVVTESLADAQPVDTAQPPADTADVNVAGTTAKATDKTDDAAATTRKPTIGSVVRQTVNAANAATKYTDETTAELANDGKASGEPEVPVKTATPAVVEPTPPVTVAVEDAPPSETTVPAPAPIRWPDITITGVVGRDQKGAAFVNGKVYGVNETVDGVRILSIKPQGVLLEYQGETRLAKIGQPVNRGVRK